MSPFAALFPGQGSQFVGMGRSLYRDFKIVKDIFEEASDVSHLNIKGLCFDGPSQSLDLTQNTQPCLLTVSVAAFRVAQSEFGFLPDMTAGHSLGEYCALIAAKSISLSSGAHWVYKRAEAMQDAVPVNEGKMVALLGIEDPQAIAICKRASQIAQSKRVKHGENSAQNKNRIEAIVEPANFNAPGQIVISGSCDAADEAVLIIKEDTTLKTKTKTLSVSAPFHSRLMVPAAEKMAEIFANADDSSKPKKPAFIYWPNKTALPTDDANLIFNLLIEQIVNPVLWRQSMESMLDSGLKTAISFGPGNVLEGLLKRIVKAKKLECESFTVSETQDIKDLEKMLKKGGKRD